MKVQIHPLFVLAIHESAHCYACKLFSLRFGRVQLTEVEGDVGFVEFDPAEFDATAPADAALIAVIGAIAEARIRQRDEAEVNEVDSRLFESAIARVPADAREALRESVFQRAESVVALGWDEIEQLAAALFERKSMTADEVAPYLI